MNSQTCAMSEFKAGLAAVFITVKLKQVVSSDRDKYTQKLLIPTNWKRYLSYNIPLHDSKRQASLKLFLRW